MSPELFLIEYHSRERDLVIEAEHRLACLTRPQSTRPAPHAWLVRRLLAVATH